MNKYCMLLVLQAFQLLRFTVMEPSGVSRINWREQLCSWFFMFAPLFSWFLGEWPHFLRFGTSDVELVYFQSFALACIYCSYSFVVVVFVIYHVNEWNLNYVGTLGWALVAPTALWEPNRCPVGQRAKCLLFRLRTKFFTIINSVQFICIAQIHNKLVSGLFTETFIHTKAN